MNSHIFDKSPQFIKFNFIVKAQTNEKIFLFNFLL